MSSIPSGAVFFPTRFYSVAEIDRLICIFDERIRLFLFQLNKDVTKNTDVLDYNANGVVSFACN